MSAARSAKSTTVILVLLGVTLAALYLNIAGGTLAEKMPAQGLVIGANTGSPVLAPAGDTVQVTLVAPYHTTSWDERDPSRAKFEMPMVYLRRQRQPSPMFERTIELRIAGPVSDTHIRLEAASLHADVATGESHRIVSDFEIPAQQCTAEQPCAIQWILDATTLPSDFYRLRVTDLAGQTLWENPHLDRPDLVALDTWDAALGAEHTVHITYATLFPYARGEENLNSRLSPAAVADFIEHSFARLISETWHTQFERWGFGQPLHPDWDRDRVVDVIVNAPPFALMDGSGTYTALAYSDGQDYPERRIWWRSSMESYARYDALENGYRAIFAHEFFHLMQWNVLLNAGLPEDLWIGVFIEPQADFAISAQYPELELSRSHLVIRNGAYGDSANQYLTRRLNSSYVDFGEDAAQNDDMTLYWRFLYEQYGGMDVVRAALEEMGSSPQNADVVSGIGEVMNRAFSRVAGPFQTFEASLIEFARANYALRLENGRCASQDASMCGGRYFDPQALYAAPTLEALLQYDGQQLTTIVAQGQGDSSRYRGAIPSSYGMDFIEVDLDPTVLGQPATVRVQAEGQGARFSVQIWRLRRGDLFPSALVSAPEVVPQDSDGAHTVVIRQLDNECNRLALIITRVDPNEATDSVGAYTVTID
jgi:hypothetical protein